MRPSPIIPSCTPRRYGLLRDSNSNPRGLWHAWRVAHITKTSEWATLADHYDKVKDLHLRDLFARDPERGERFGVDINDLYVDYSKNRVTNETIDLLLAVASRAGLAARIEAMFSGERINVTEDRSVLHVALRARIDDVFEADGHNVVPGVHAVLGRMARFADRVRRGEWPVAKQLTDRIV